MNQQQQYGAAPWMQQPPKKGWLGRNWKWLVPSGCLGMMLLLVGFVAAIMFIVFGAIKSTEVYRNSIEMAKASPKAQEQLGTPIKEGWFVRGSVKTFNSSGYAKLWIPVSGPKGSGEIFAEAIKSEDTNGGRWVWESLVLNVEGGEIISLLERPTAGAPSLTEPSLTEPPPAEPDTESPTVVERRPIIEELSNPDRLRGGVARPVAPDTDAAPKVEVEDAPPPPAAATPTPARTPKVISGGVLNGKAISKPQPAYPPIARAARAQGTVTVQITVDEQGRVISASAVSGHPLLQAAAVQAARQARFSPTLLSGQPVKVNGVITYNFVLQQ